MTILQELLQHKVVLNERGKTRKIILLEAILRKVAEDCLRGNIKSVGFLLNRYYAPPQATLRRLTSAKTTRRFWKLTCVTSKPSRTIAEVSHE